MMSVKARVSGARMRFLQKAKQAHLQVMSETKASDITPVKRKRTNPDGLNLGAIVSYVNNKQEKFMKSKVHADTTSTTIYFNVTVPVIDPKKIPARDPKIAIISEDGKELTYRDGPKDITYEDYNSKPSVTPSAAPASIPVVDKEGNPVEKPPTPEGEKKTSEEKKDEDVTRLRPADKNQREFPLTWWEVVEDETTGREPGEEQRYKIVIHAHNRMRGSKKNGYSTDNLEYVNYIPYTVEIKEGVGFFISLTDFEGGVKYADLATGNKIYLKDVHCNVWTSKTKGTIECMFKCEDLDKGRAPEHLAPHEYFTGLGFDPLYSRGYKPSSNDTVLVIHGNMPGQFYASQWNMHTVKFEDACTKTLTGKVETTLMTNNFMALLEHHPRYLPAGLISDEDLELIGTKCFRVKATCQGEVCQGTGIIDLKSWRQHIATLRLAPFSALLRISQKDTMGDADNLGDLPKVEKDGVLSGSAFILRVNWEPVLKHRGCIVSKEFALKIADTYSLSGLVRDIAKASRGIVRWPGDKCVILNYKNSKEIKQLAKNPNRRYYVLMPRDSAFHGSKNLKVIQSNNKHKKIKENEQLITSVLEDRLSGEEFADARVLVFSVENYSTLTKKTKSSKRKLLEIEAPKPEEKKVKGIVDMPEKQKTPEKEVPVEKTPEEKSPNKDSQKKSEELDDFADFDVEMKTAKKGKKQKSHKRSKKRSKKKAAVEKSN